jgi:phosphoglycerate-specific signal transduction histidine kinase
MGQRRFGVRWRLLLAFFGISAFAVLAAAAAMYAFFEVDQSLGRIVQQRVPAAIGAQDISRQAERIIAAAPSLLAASNPEKLEQQSEEIQSEFDRLQVLLSSTDWCSTSRNENCCASSQVPTLPRYGSWLREFS